MSLQRFANPRSLERCVTLAHPAAADREYDERGVEYVWVLGGHLYGEPDASRAWSDTFVAFFY